MELLMSYDSDTSDSASCNTKSRHEKLENDFFNLDESDSEDVVTENFTDLMYQAAQLKDEPYGPFHNAHLVCDAESNINILCSKETPVLNKSCMLNNKKRTVDEIDVSETNVTKLAKGLSSEEKILVENASYDVPHKNFIPKRVSHLFHDHDATVSSLHWNYWHSNLLLSSSMDNTCKIWSMTIRKCVKDFAASSIVKSAKWTSRGKEVIYGGYDKKATIHDVESSTCITAFDIKDFVSCIEVHADLQDIFLIGTKNNVLAFDKRCDNHKPIKNFSSSCQYILDLKFMKRGTEFIASTDIVSRDSSDKTIMVWDFASGAILSNQIYNERYTCPCIKVSPDEKYFVVQSNGNYIAIFSTKRPYKLQTRRFMGHEVAGYSIGCDFSPDSKILLSGDAKGGLYFYDSQSCDLIKKIEGKCEIPAVQVQWHPFEKSTIATGYWDGSLQILR